MEPKVNIYIEEGNSSSGKPKKDRLSPVVTKKMKVNYKFYSQKNGYDTIAEAMRAGIRAWLDGSIKIEKHIDERNLSDIAELEKIYGSEIVKYNDFNKKGKGDFDIWLPTELLQKFDEHWKLQNFRGKSEACRALMYYYIMKWKESYKATVNVEKSKKTTPNPEDMKKLNQKLEELKHDYELGLELDVVEWIPDAKNDKHGEVKGNKIYIYDETYEEADETLEHEFDHYCMNKYCSQPLVDAVNFWLKSTMTFWKKVMENFNNGITYKERERLIEKHVEKSIKARLFSD